MAAASVLNASTAGPTLEKIRKAMVASKEYHWQEDVSDEKIWGLLERSLIDACKGGRTGEVKALLTFGTRADCQSSAPMKAAVRSGHAEIVRELVRFGAPINCGAFCARLVAAKMGYEHILKELPYRDSSVAICEHCQDLANLSSLSVEEATERPAMVPTAKFAVYSLEGKTRGDGLVGAALESEKEGPHHGVALAKVEPWAVKSGSGKNAPSSGVDSRRLATSPIIKPPAAVAKDGSQKRAGMGVEQMQELLDKALDTAVASGNIRHIGIFLAKGASRKHYLVPVKASGRSKSKGPSKMRVATADEVQEAMDRALIETAASGSAKQTRDLITGGAKPGCKGNAPLKAAIKSNNVEVVNCLMDAGAVFDDSVIDQPVIWAALRRHYDLVKRLVDNYKIPADQLSAALLYMVKEQRMDLILLLLSKGADPNHEHGAPLVYAAFYGNVPLAELLLDNGALHYAFRGVRISVNAKEGIYHQTYYSVGQKNIADHSAPRYYNALMEAASIGRNVMVDFLVEQGSNLRALKEDALIHAVRSFSPQNFAELLEELEYPHEVLNEALAETFWEEERTRYSGLLIEHGASPVEAAAEIADYLEDADHQFEDGVVCEHRKIFTRIICAACKYGDEDSIEELINTYDYDAFDFKRVIMALTANDQYVRIRFLLEDCLIPLSSLPERQALFIAVRSECWEIATQILESRAHPPGELDMALSVVAEQDCPEFWGKLLARGAHIVSVRDPLTRVLITTTTGHLPSMVTLIEGQGDLTERLALADIGLQYAAQFPPSRITAYLELVRDETARLIGE